MKKLFIYVSLFVVVFSSCKKDENTDGLDLENPTYAPKTVAETKSDLENTGVNMVNELKSFNQDKGVIAAVNLVDLASSTSSAKATNNQAFKMLSLLKAVKENNATVKTMLAELQTAGDPGSLDDLFNEIAGTYTYNFTTSDFDFSANPDAASVVFSFPASKASKQSQTLDGTFEIFRPQYKTGNFIYSNDTTTELPTSLKYELKVNSELLMSYNFTAAYTDEGVPTSVVSTLTVGTFEFKVTYGYSSSNLNANYSFKHGTTTILDLGAAFNGNFDKTNIENTENNEDPTTVLYNANAHFQFMDIKIAGDIDFKSLYNALKDGKDSVASQAADEINKNANLVVVYASNNQAIAKAEAYATTYNDSEWHYNFQTGQWEEISVVKEKVDIRMIFADKSKSDLKTYFDEGFDQLIDSFNSFIDDLNNTYGWSMEHVTKNTPSGK